MEKGFDVVAVEANPDLYNLTQGKFARELSSGKLILHNRVISNLWKGSIGFYVNKKRPEVSSTEKWIASQNGQYEVESYLVSSMSLDDLLFIHGTPYYLKVDIEGADKLIASSLTLIKDKPKYVSFELNKNDYKEIFENLKKAGYTEFQLINQIHNKPNHSGPFGEFLDQDKWLDFDVALERYEKYRELKMIDNINLGVGWLDLHAKLYN